MKKKVLSALLVAAMSVSVLAGCGSKADNNTDAKNDASQENTLSVWCWDPNFNVNETGRGNLPERSPGFQTGYSGKSIFRY